MSDFKYVRTVLVEGPRQPLNATRLFPKEDETRPGARSHIARRARRTGGTDRNP